MNIAADIKAAEGFAKALEGIDPAKLVDTALKFMSSTRSRIEAGEKRIAELEGKLGSALATIDKLSGILGGTAGIDFSAFESEIAAMEKTAPAAPSGNGIHAAAAVTAAVPDADPSHVSEAVAAHAEAMADGATHDDAKVAAETAAKDVGATDEQAKAIAEAIPAPQPQAGDHPDTAMAAAGLPAAGPLPTTA